MADQVAIRDYAVFSGGVLTTKGIPIKLHDNGDGTWSEAPQDLTDAAVRWNFAPPTGGIVNSTVAQTLAAAAGAGLKNYLTGLQISADTLGAAVEVVVRNGASGTVIFRTKLQTAGTAGVFFQFEEPLPSSANTLLEVATVTAVTGGVYVNAQGYIAP